MSDSLEFLLSQYLDGTLPDEQRAALQRRIESDPHARALLEEYRALDSLLKRSMTLPAVKWDALAGRISGTLTEQAEPGADASIETSAVDGSTEFAITQYLDGELVGEQRAALERRLAEDPAAQAVLEQHRSLNAFVKDAWPLPQVAWDRLAGHLSEAVAESAQRARYSIVWARRTAAVALAVCVLIIVGLVAQYAGGPAAPPAVAEVTGPQPETATGTAVADISIGATPAVAQRRVDPYASAVVSVPSRVQLADTTVRRSADVLFLQ